MQAEKSAWNSLSIFKVSNISGKKREPVPTKSGDDESNMGSDDSGSDEDSEDEELGGSGAPVLQAIVSFFFFLIGYLPFEFSHLPCLVLISSLSISNVLVVMCSCAR